jgi:hypothetical protein
MFNVRGFQNKCHPMPRLEVGLRFLFPLLYAWVLTELYLAYYRLINNICLFCGHLYQCLIQKTVKPQGDAGDPAPAPAPDLVEDTTTVADSLLRVIPRRGKGGACR